MKYTEIRSLKNPVLFEGLLEDLKAKKSLESIKETSSCKLLIITFQLSNYIFIQAKPKLQILKDNVKSTETKKTVLFQVLLEDQKAELIKETNSCKLFVISFQLSNYIFLLKQMLYQKY